MKEWIWRYRMPVFLIIAALAHLAAFTWVRFALPQKETGADLGAEVFKLVDVEEYLPPPPPPETPVTKVMEQPKAAETVTETEEAVVEVKDESELSPPAVDYLPQHKISVVPAIPTSAILERIQYPPIALRQGIEGVVYLELFIDEEGTIRKITVLKDPGFGFAEAALAALEGIRCEPARANGKPAAVRFRYPVRFTLK